MRRQPGSIPTEGQVVADQKAETVPSLAPVNANSHAPTGLRDYPGVWGPVDEAEQQDYVSPAGTLLLVTGGDDPEVEHDPNIAEDAFQFYPEEGDAQGLRNDMNEALTRVAAQKAAANVMSYCGDIYERISTEARWALDDDGERRLQTLTVTVKDFEADRFLEMEHDYNTGTTTVSDAHCGELDLGDSNAERHSIINDLVRDQGINTGESHEEVFGSIHDEFQKQDERFGLD